MFNSCPYFYNSYETRIDEIFLRPSVLNCCGSAPIIGTCISRDINFSSPTYLGTFQNMTTSTRRLYNNGLSRYTHFHLYIVGGISWRRTFSRNLYNIIYSILSLIFSASGKILISEYTPHYSSHVWLHWSTTLPRSSVKQLAVNKINRVVYKYMRQRLQVVASFPGFSYCKRQAIKAWEISLGTRLCKLHVVSWWTQEILSNSNSDPNLA